jgi:streptogramin lyase
MEESVPGLVRMRDATGNWSVLAGPGTDLDHVLSPAGLAFGPWGTLYVADTGMRRVTRRDPDGTWSLMASAGERPGQVCAPRSLRFTAADDLLIADWGRVGRLDPRGRWTAEGTFGYGPGQLYAGSAVAMTPDGSLWVAEVQGMYSNSQNRLQVRDSSGKWTSVSNVDYTGMASDAEGNLYLAAPSLNEVWSRDRLGAWTVVASKGSAAGQVLTPMDVAVDVAGRLNVAEAGNRRIQRLDPRASPAPLLGDVDGDGQTTVSDVLSLLRMVVGLSPIGPDALAAADLDQDGLISTRDAVLLLRRL